MSFTPISADVEAAFLQGDEVKREHGDIYLRQPKEGFPGLAPGVLVRVAKAIFGFAESPQLWWKKFTKRLLEMRAVETNGSCRGEELRFTQSLFDPALFVCRCRAGQVRGVCVVHVDDLMFGVDPECPELAKQMREVFPFGSLKSGDFEYCGKQVRT